jgi:competence protein ComGC
MQRMMAKQLNLNNTMAALINKLLFVLLLLVIPNINRAQEHIQHFKSIALSEVEMVSIDRVGFFYTIQKNGTITKFSEDAEQVAEHKQNGKNKFDLFEAWNGMRLIGFNKENKNYSLFDRLLNLQETSTLDEALVIDPYLATITGDNSLWVLDGKVSTLKKVNTSSESVDLEISIDTKHSGDLNLSNHIKEYQNMLFVNTPDAGIWVYNSNIGKRMKILPFKQVNYFNFLGMDLYFIQENKLHLYDLYSGDHGIYELPLAAKFVLLTDETMLLVDNSHIHFYRIDLTDD